MVPWLLFAIADTITPSFARVRKTFQEVTLFPQTPHLDNAFPTPVQAMDSSRKELVSHLQLLTPALAAVFNPIQA
jgi:hypothetical protein